jgi:hypothetical protein
MHLLYPYFRFGSSLGTLKYGALSFLLIFSGFSTFSQTGQSDSIRFTSIQLTISGCHPVPSGLVSFKARLQNNLVKLDWTAPKETHISHFVIQRSLEGMEFNDDAIVFTEGTSTVLKNYSFSDNITSINSRQVFYRLKIVGIDERDRYSGVVSLRLQNDFEEAVRFIPDYPSFNKYGSLIKQKVDFNAGLNETFACAGTPLGLYLFEQQLPDKLSNKNFQNKVKI